MGRGDSDSLLETGKRFLVKVDTRANPLTKYTVFTLEFAPDDRSALIIERTIPAIVDSVMDLL